MIVFERLMNVLSYEDSDSIKCHIAKTLLHNINLVNEFSIDEISKICNVSKSSISKFVRQIGFDDYKDFKLEVIRLNNKDVYGKSNNHMNITDYIIDKGIYEYIHILNGDFINTIEHINIKQLDKLITLIHDTKNIASFGDIYSGSAAQNLQYKMAFYRKNIYTSKSETRQEEYIKNAEKDDLIIIFSNKGNFINYYQFTDGNPDKDWFDVTEAKVVLITSNKSMVYDKRLIDVITYENNNKVWNHPFLYQLIIEMIAYRYQIKYGFPNFI